MKNKKKTGIILAAGLGTRLREAQSAHPAKPLVPINDLALLLRTIHSHEVAERDCVVIVLGWQAESVKRYVLSEYKGSVDLKFVVNKHFHLQNGLSALCARPFMDDVFILTMADHILDDHIMQLAGRHQPIDSGATLCVDYKIDSIFDIDDATKVYAEGNLIKHIGKVLDTYNCIDTGVFIGTDGLMEAISKVYRENGDASLSEGVQLLSGSGKMGILDIEDAFWQDVDTPEMLAHAEKYLSSVENIPPVAGTPESENKIKV